MAKAKTAAADEMATGFKSLSADNKAWMKSFEETGWRFEFTENDGWSAVKEYSELAEDRVDVGPTDSFMVMMNLVEKEEKKRGGALGAGLKKETADGKGNTFLPGAEPIVVKELVDLAKRRIELTKEHRRLTQALIEINEDCENAAEKHRQHFIEDPVTHSLTYHAAGVTLEIVHSEKVKVRTSLDDPDDEDI